MARYLVLEYCGGGDVLDRIISDGAMDELSSLGLKGSAGMRR